MIYIFLIFFLSFPFFILLLVKFKKINYLFWFYLGILFLIIWLVFFLINIRFNLTEFFNLRTYLKGSERENLMIYLPVIIQSSIMLILIKFIKNIKLLIINLIFLLIILILIFNWILNLWQDFDSLFLFVFMIIYLLIYIWYWIILLKVSKKFYNNKLENKEILLKQNDPLKNINENISNKYDKKNFSLNKIWNNYLLFFLIFIALIWAISPILWKVIIGLVFLLLSFFILWKIKNYKKLWFFLLLTFFLLFFTQNINPIIYPNINKELIFEWNWYKFLDKNTWINNIYTSIGWSLQWPKDWIIIKTPKTFNVIKIFSRFSCIWKTNCLFLIKDENWIEYIYKAQLSLNNMIRESEMTSDLARIHSIWVKEYLWNSLYYIDMLFLVFIIIAFIILFIILI